MNLNKAYVYFLSNKNRTVLYIGVTNDLERRIAEHRSGNGTGFAKKYNAFELIYYEIHNDIKHAIAREKKLKEWKRSWKIDLIKTMNEDMVDLANDWEYELGERNVD